MARLFLFIFSLTIFVPLTGWAQTPYQNCVSANENAGGGAAACAVQICKLQDCKDANAGNAGNCQTLEQSMFQCFRENPTPKPTPTVNQWCKNGRDADIPLIRTKVAALKKTIEPKQAKRKQTYDIATNLRTQYQSLNAHIKDESAAHALVKSDTPKTYKKYQKKWIKNGRLDKLNSDIKRLKQIKSEFDKALASYKQADIDYKTTLKSYKTITQTMLDNNHDCQGALSALR